MPHEPYMAPIADELGWQSYSPRGVAARCPFGYPAVVETRPFLIGGMPNQTPLYITCSALAEMVSRAEGEGYVRRLETACRTDEPLRRLLARVTQLYEQRRRRPAATETDGTMLTARLGAGIGGPEGPETASCLHALAAGLLAVLTGWLGGTSQGDTGLVAQARRAWARFLPPIKDCWCRDGRCSRWDAGRRRGAIDVGAVSVRLLVADVLNDRPWPLLRAATVTRLDEGLRPGSALTDVGRQRTARAVTRFADEARSCGVDSLILAGTNTARKASDGSDFIYDLGQENALPTVVLSAAREAELTYAGVSLDIQDEPVVLRVEGGSSELIGRSENGLVETVSLELEAGRAGEALSRSDPPTVRQTARVYHEASEAFGRVRRQFGAGPKERRLVGVAGTITTLACLDAGLGQYDAEAVHLRDLSLRRVQALTACLSAMTTDERAALPCVQVGRAPLIVGEAVVVQAAMETLGYDALRVSEHDLLDGLVLRPA
jgi:exopolyphosphatase / guanosine-5'-triphosphate,3'-diphosphate pyrophosphatase